MAANLRSLHEWSFFFPETRKRFHANEWLLLWVHNFIKNLGFDKKTNNFNLFVQMVRRTFLPIFWSSSSVTNKKWILFVDCYTLITIWCHEVPWTWIKRTKQKNVEVVIKVTHKIMEEYVLVWPLNGIYRPTHPSIFYRIV